MYKYNKEMEKNSTTQAKRNRNPATVKKYLWQECVYHNVCSVILSCDLEGYKTPKVSIVAPYFFLR